MSCDRVIILVDMDCFYCQVEEKLDPYLQGKPIAVVQYNAWRGGGIIAVNYPAREKGVTRHMRGNEAKQKCPDIMLARVPEVRGKADLTRYREAGKRVAEVLQLFTPLLERASVDEAYLDITEVVKKRMVNDFDQVHHNNLKNTYIVGYDIQDFLHNITRNRAFSEINCRLAVGGLIAEEIRAEVNRKTGYKCSAGIAHNKVLAKLACGLHKPNKQTILPHESVPVLYKDLPLRKIPGLGGKFGVTITEQLKISKMGELIEYNEKQLIKVFEEKTAKWLHNIAKGIDHEPVTPRLISKSIGCCKKFPGRSALVTPESVQHWVGELTAEISERIQKDIEENDRRAKQITLHFTQTVKDKDITNSRTLPLNSYDQPRIAQICLDAIKKYCVKSNGNYNIKYLGFSVGNFEHNKKIGNISELFKNMNDFNIQRNQKSFENIDNVHKLDIPEHNVSKEVTSPLDAQLEDEIDIIPQENQSDMDDNISVYSAETDELNEDMKGFIYYEDIFPERVASQPIFIKPLNMSNNSDVKSGPIEIISESLYRSTEGSIQSSPSSSFFSKFFENYNADEDSHDSSPIERNFDTSKILDTELEHFDENVTPCKLFKTIEDNAEVDKTTLHEICPECKKNVLQSEFVSHMDHHYALNIVRDEASVYNTQSNRNKNGREQFSICRKVANKRVKDMRPIHRYLQIDELTDENSELCSECNKRIKLDDIINHMDYHAARKLHVELNAKLSSTSSKKIVKTQIKGKRKKKINVPSTENIKSFFKS